MGCCTSSPHARRRYRDPADLDEIHVSSEEDLHRFLDHTNPNNNLLPLRTFGIYRNNGVVVPDDIDGLPSCRLIPTLATNPDVLLYEAEIDNAYAWRCLRPVWIVFGICPPLWPAALACLQAGMCSCDEIVCWVRKEYSSRHYYRVYPNRIEINQPFARIPFGCCGCGSWNGDHVLAHPFDRGAFGFRSVACAPTKFCFCLPLCGDAVARQRCQCNGPPWGAGVVTRGWWCDEWCCDILCCSYHYKGLANGEEVAAASNLALQAYYEGRRITRTDLEAALEYWRQHVSEEYSPVERKRPTVCEDTCGIPCCCTGALCYSRVYQCRRTIPPTLEHTREIQNVYDNYETLRKRQIERYNNVKVPLKLSTCCKALGCQRCCGRKGVFFCTEGCNHQQPVGCCYKKIDNKKDDPFPPFTFADHDDDNDAARILQTVLGNPPPNVEYKRWIYDESNGEYRVENLRATNLGKGVGSNTENNMDDIEVNIADKNNVGLVLENGTGDIELAVPKDA